jgi:hypothetical protein
MCTVLLPSSGNPIAVEYIISKAFVSVKQRNQQGTQVRGTINAFIIQLLQVSALSTTYCKSWGPSCNIRTVSQKVDGSTESCRKSWIINPYNMNRVAHTSRVTCDCFLFLSVQIQQGSFCPLSVSFVYKHFLKHHSPPACRACELPEHLLQA